MSSDDRNLRFITHIDHTSSPRVQGNLLTVDMAGVCSQLIGLACIFLVFTSIFVFQFDKFIKFSLLSNLIFVTSCFF